MVRKRKPRISNIPLVLSLFIILIFGAPTTLMISVYEFRMIIDGRKAIETEYLGRLKERLRQDLDVAVAILDFRRKGATGVGDCPEAFEPRIKQEMIQTFRFFNNGSGTKGIVIDADGHLLIGNDAQKGPFDHGGRAGLDRALETVVDAAKANQEGYAFVLDETPSVSRNTAPATALVYGRYYAPWEWTLATVVDLEPFHAFSRKKFAQLQENVLKKYLFLFAVMMGATGFAVFTGKLFARRLRKNLHAFERFFHAAGSSPNQIDSDRIPFDELVALGNYANAMVRERVKNEETIRSVNGELQKANQSLEEMARMDGLTGVANRRFFDDALGREWARAAREQRPVVLGMVDIDHFKQFNDTYGHPAGDECLKQVATALKTAIRRPADLVARYGGEEFVVLLPGTDLDGGKAVADQMRENVAALGLPHHVTATGRVSFSMGLACRVPEPGSGPETAVKAADQALYRAKANGRDRIETDSEASSEI